MIARPERIVSLVPSLTEALFVLGLGDRVVGVTDWCVHPARGVAGLPKVGGTKTPDLAAIRALQPDLVIANREENRRTDVERLQRDGLQVWVTDPRTVRGGAELLAKVAALGAGADRTRAVVEPTLAAVTPRRGSPGRRCGSGVLSDLARSVDGSGPRHLHPRSHRPLRGDEPVRGSRGSAVPPASSWMPWWRPLPT